MSDPTPQEGELILYRTGDDAVRVEVIYEAETFWLDQRRMAVLFGIEVPTISYHLKEIYASGELARDPTVRRIPRAQREGHREVRREIEFYNLDAIISVGYRVNSTQATQFRIWATQTSTPRHTEDAFRPVTGRRGRRTRTRRCRRARRAG